MNLQSKGWKKSEPWEGLEVWSGVVDGRACRIVPAPKPIQANPWAWRTEFFGAFANADVALVKSGVSLVYMDVQDHYGCPKAMDHFDVFYKFLREEGFGPRSAMIGLSRGGLFAWNYASRFPERVASLYADNPVCDFKSWPGGKGSGPGSPGDWKKLLTVYGFKNEAEAMSWPGNPIDNLEPVARAGIPCLHVCGDADETVPYLENTYKLDERFRILGGKIEIILKPGGLHHPHGLEDPAPIVDFVLKHF